MLIVAKSYASAVRLTLGNNQLNYHYPLGSRKQHKLSDIADWQEEVVKSNSREYCRLTIKLENGKKLQLSNHENSNYIDVIRYLKKKVKRH